MSEPDYSYWDVQEEWTLEESACLVCGIDPRFPTNIGDIGYAKIRLKIAAFSNGELPYRDETKKEIGNYESTGTTFIKETGDYIFKSADVKKWARGNNIQSAYLISELRKQDNKEKPEEVTIDGALIIARNLLQIDESDDLLVFDLRLRISDAAFDLGEIAWRTTQERKTVTRDGKEYTEKSGNIFYDKYDIELWILKNREYFDNLKASLKNKTKTNNRDSETTNSENSPFYSEELDIANKAYKALYIDGGYSSKKGHIPQICEWLENNYKNKLSAAAKERIATVVNPNKSGGAPKAS